VAFFAFRGCAGRSAGFFCSVAGFSALPVGAALAAAAFGAADLAGAGFVAAAFVAARFVAARFVAAGFVVADLGADVGAGAGFVAGDFVGFVDCCAALLTTDVLADGSEGGPGAADASGVLFSRRAFGSFPAGGFAEAMCGVARSMLRFAGRNDSTTRVTVSPIFMISRALRGAGSAISRSGTYA
jgi:hypothetical protein